MKLLFITTKIHEKDDDFAFSSLWVEEFIRQGFDVSVICHEKGVFTGNFPVYSLGREKGFSNFKSLLIFLKLIFKLDYDRVFVHMNPKWVVPGALLWRIKKIPVYLWYTHYTMHFPLRVSHWLCKRLFCATENSMPQYDKDPKKVVTGHGIDMRFWNFNNVANSEKKPKTELLSVHRICRSKRLDLVIKALQFLPNEYNLTVYGRELEDDYAKEIKDLIEELGFGNRVKLMGSVPMPKLLEIYPQYQIMINMAMETIDKTMVEAMLAGIQVVTTPNNARAIGMPNYPKEETPEAIAEYIKNIDFLSAEELRRITRKNHSLESLIKKMGEYIKSGN
ncbi:glycosyltransferase family 4 protein [Candidatus Parcubacteria bacterium]|nr:glycosyltransferase family 4 protein [Candidatus Parcubacteria bacterium]